MNIIDKLLQIKKLFKSFYYQLKGIILKNKNYQIIAQLERAPGYQDIPPSPEDQKEIIHYLKRRKNEMKRPNHDRYQLIPVPKDKTVLDLGANLGYFGFVWSHDIKKYIGIDNDPLCVKAAEALKNSRGLKNLIFIEADVINFMENTQEEYDVCLFFSLYHHILYNAGKNKACQLLKYISKLCDVMYFDMGQRDEQNDYPKRKWYEVLPDKPPEVYIPEEIITNSEFMKYRILGETNVGMSRRLLFRFEK